LPPLVSTIVVTWNGADLLPACLDALARQSCDDAELIVVDNGSHDGSPELVARLAPHARVIALPINQGFAGGTNAGLAAATGRYVFLVNNDARPAPDCLMHLVATLNADARLGMVAPRIVLAASGRIDSAGIVIDRAAMAHQRLRGAADAGLADRSTAVFGASGACALLRRELLTHVGAFDQRFGSFYEDVDLSWRARLAGWEVAYVPAARVVHDHSATAARNPARKDFLLARNRIWCAVKNYPQHHLVAHLPLLLAYDLAILAGRLSAGRRGAVAGRWAALRGLGPFVQARREVQTRLATPAGQDRAWQLMRAAGSPWALALRGR
jgi:GT2 family glycosyltransferase